MIPWLPWIAIVLAFAAFVLRLGWGRQRVPGLSLKTAFTESLLQLAELLVLCVVALLCAWKWGKGLEGLRPGVMGLCLGTVAVYVAHLFSADSGQSPWALALSLAVPTAALGVSHWIKTEVNICHFQLGMVVGGMISAFVVSVGDRRVGVRAACVASVFLGSIVAADYLGRQAAGGRLAMAGLALGIVATFTAAAAPLLVSGGGKKEVGASGIVWAAACVVIAALGGVLVARKFLSLGDAWILFSGSVVLGAIVHWFMPEDGEGNLRFALAVALWLAVAVEAYTRRRGLGMSFALLGGASISILLGNRRAILALAPLAGLVFYHIFREAYPDASRALDINQHYAMIGVFAGAVLPLIAVEWLAASRSTMLGRGLWAAAIWVALMLGVPVAGVILLGPKGAAGYLVGLGMAAAIQGLKGTKFVSSLSIAMGLAATMTLAYGWLGSTIDMTREDKGGLLGRILLDVLALAVLVALLSRDRREKKAI